MAIRGKTRPASKRYTRGPKALRIWMAEHGITGERLRQQLGCSNTMVSLWRHGHVRPSPVYRRLIAKATKGAIPETFRW